MKCSRRPTINTRSTTQIERTGASIRRHLPVTRGASRATPRVPEPAPDLPGDGDAPEELAFYVARQPIFDRDRKLRAYELLFRGDATAESAQITDGSSATARLITHGALLGDSYALSGGHPLFINFNRDLLVAGAATLLDPKRYAIEVLEDVPPDEEVLSSCRALIDGGYRVALDDVTESARLEAFAGHVTLVKVDLLGIESEHVSDVVDEAQRQRIELLAEKVESGDELSVVSELGFDYFQGYYLSRPESVKRSALPGLKPAHVKLLSIVNQRDLDFDEVARAIEADPSLTYQLLRRADSVAYSLNREISSMRDVVVLFGHDEIRRAATFVVMGAIVGGTEALLQQSVTLARFCDNVGALLDTPAERRFDFYLVGLLSNIDALLGEPMDGALERLPLPDQVRAALADDEGPAAHALTLARAYMRADWTEVESAVEALDLEEADVPRLYLDAIEDADSAMQAAA